MTNRPTDNYREASLLHCASSDKISLPPTGFETNKNYWVNDFGKSEITQKHAHFLNSLFIYNSKHALMDMAFE